MAAADSGAAYADDLPQPVLAERLAHRIRHLPYAVGSDEDHLTRPQWAIGLLAIFRLIHDAERQIAFADFLERPGASGRK